jgi:hypothetical protein
MHERAAGGESCGAAGTQSVPYAGNRGDRSSIARDPADRYQSAAEILADLVAPDQVRVTGRAQHLLVPSLPSRACKVAQVVAVALLAPLFLFLLFLLVLRH